MAEKPRKKLDVDPITLSDQISTIWNRYREEEAGHA